MAHPTVSKCPFRSMRWQTFFLPLHRALEVLGGPVTIGPLDGCRAVAGNLGHKLLDDGSLGVVCVDQYCKFLVADGEKASDFLPIAGRAAARAPACCGCPRCPDRRHPFGWGDARQIKTAAETPKRVASALACRALICRLPVSISLTTDWVPSSGARSACFSACCSMRNRST